MAQHLVELCTILVEESFGDSAALIWARLAALGRTQFTDLAHLTRIATTQLLQILPILILNRTVVHYIDQDDNSTWYSVSLEGTYSLLRMSRLGDVVKERCGKDAAHIMLNMAQLGHITVDELIKVYRLEPERQAHTNGDLPAQLAVNGLPRTATPRDVTPFKSLEQFFEALKRLIRSEFLVKANPAQFQTDFDKQQALEQSVQEEEFASGKVTGPKASALFARAVNTRKRKEREGDFVLTKILDDAEHRTPNKRLKMAAATQGSRHPVLDDVLGTTVLSVNMKKYTLALRSKSYVRLAKHHLGRSCALVYDKLLQVLEKQAHEIGDGRNMVLDDADDDDDLVATTTAAKILEILDPATDFTSSIKVTPKELPNGLANGHKEQFVQVREDFTDIGIKQEYDSEDDGQVELSSFTNRAKLLDLVERHLQTLEEHPKAFCHRKGQGKPAVWSVNFSILTENIVLAELDASITARFGKSATRLVRMLREKGKLDEKQLTALAHMQMTDVRAIVTELYGTGYLEAQELAKDQTRQPAKALYLWYFDAARVQRMLIYQSYQAMARLYQRLAQERENYSSLIEKVQRLTEGRFFGDNYYDPISKAEEDDAAHQQTNGALSHEEGGQIKPAPPIKFVLGTTGMWKHMETLNQHERLQVQQWRAIEANFLGQIMRLDDLIILLRDFSGQYSITSE